MTRKILIVLAACALASSLAFAQGAPAPKKAAQPTPATAGAPDKALIQRVLDGWTTMNPDNVKKYYDQAPDAVFYDVAPLKWVGFNAYSEGVKPMFAALSSIRFTMNDDTVVHSAGNLAWATTTVKTVMTDKAGKATDLDCRYTVIWQKKAGGWVIVHDHFSAPLPQ